MPKKTPDKTRLRLIDDFKRHLDEWDGHSRLALVIGRIGGQGSETFRVLEVFRKKPEDANAA